MNYSTLNVSKVLSYGYTNVFNQHDKRVIEEKVLYNTGIDLVKIFNDCELSFREKCTILNKALFDLPCIEKFNIIDLINEDDFDFARDFA